MLETLTLIEIGWFLLRIGELSGASAVIHRYILIWRYTGTDVYNMRVFWRGELYNIIRRKYNGMASQVEVEVATHE